MSVPIEERSTLKQRAVELSRELPSEADADGQIEVVEFDLGGERYAIELKSIREISRHGNLTPVPGTPAFVLGIINLRGEIRTVIDLKIFFDLPANGIMQFNQIIFIEHEDIQVGLLADAIRGVRRISLDEIQPALPTMTGLRGAYLRGIAPGCMGLLDVPRILSDPNLLVNDHAEI